MDIRSPFFSNLALALAGILFLNPIVATAAQLTVDAATGGNTSLGQAGNGVPLVNIATPNGKGLSHNKFTDYNVGQQGLILNNATERTQSTQLGGIILGNPNLNGRAAGMILNEVTGSNKSQLKGYTEVAGQAARVIVANPHGITCDGCGFINTPRVSLSTGKPVIANGMLDRFDVDGGQISIEGAGLNAGNTDQFDLITRSAKINAELHAQQLNVITGRNEVEADSLAATAKAEDGRAKPHLAIDSSALGGMYAGAIRLVGTEAGVGVKLAGDMAASAGDILIDANGQLSLARTAVSRDLQLNAESIELTGDAYAGRNTTIRASRVEVKESLAVGDHLRVDSNLLSNTGIIEAGVHADGSLNSDGHLQLNGGHVDNPGRITSHGSLAIDVESLNNQSGALTAAGNATLQANSLNNQDGRVLAQHDLIVEVDATNNSTGELITGRDLTIIGTQLHNSGSITAHGSLAIDVQSLNNQGGSVLAQRDLIVEVDATDNSTGELIAGRDLTIIGTQLHNPGRITAHGSLAIDVQSLNNQGGALTAASNATLKANSLNNQDGRVLAQRDLIVEADATDNRAGELIVGRDLAVIGTQLNNQGGIAAANGAIKAELSGALNNFSGLVEAGTTLAITADSLSNKNGLLRALGNSGISRFGIGGRFDNNNGKVEIGNAQFNLSADLFEQASGGRLLALGSLDADGVDWRNDGEINTQALRLQLGGTYQGNGSLLSEQDLFITADDLDLGTTGRLRTGGQAELHFDDVLRSSGVITAAQNLTLTAGKVHNLGTLGSAGAVRINAKEVLNESGLLFSGADMQLRGKTLINRFGDIYSLGSLDFFLDDQRSRAELLENISGTIESAADMRMSVDSLINRKHKLAFQQRLVSGRITLTWTDNCKNDNCEANYYVNEIYAPHITEDSASANLTAGGDLWFTGGTFENRFSSVSAGNDISINTDHFFNIGAGGGEQHYASYSIYTRSDSDYWNFTNNMERYNAYYNPSSASYNPGALSFSSIALGSRTGRSVTATSGNVVAPAIVQAGGTVKIIGSKTLENAIVREGETVQSGASRIGDTQLGTKPPSSLNQHLPPELAQQAVDPLALPGFSLPKGQNGLFRLSQDFEHPYLIETNPAFTSLGGFLNSDYMFDLMGYDLNTVQRRLGDGLYEQRLIQQAVVARTGKRFLDGLASDEAQYRYLMDNAIASRSALNLAPGIALNAEQVAALTHDIVWMEEQEVNGHKVLVPVLYLAQANDRLAPNGALIQGQDIALISGGELKNSGILRASVNLDVEAERIDNSGLMQANERLQLLATDSIRNAQGGIINGKSVTLLAESGDITNERSIGTNEGRDGGFTWSQSVADNAARIEASNDLTLVAGRDLLNIGGALQAGGNAQLLAGRDLVIGAATEEDSSQAQLKRVRASSQTITQHGSEVSIGGDMVADAGRDLSLVASKVQVGRDLAMTADRDISILSAANESHSFAKSKKGTVSADQISQQASVIQVGRDMSIAAGNDLTLVASQLKADGSVALLAGQDIQLLAEQDESAYFYSKKKDGSFGRSSSRMTASSSSTAVSSVIEAGQDLTLLANRDVLSQGTQLASNGALQVAAGHDIYLGAAENTSSQESAKTRSGLTSSRARSNASSATTLTGTSLDAQSIDLLAGNDVTLEASSVRAEGAARLSAGQDINIVTAEQYQSSSSFKQSSKLGLSPSIATGVSVSLTEKGQRAQQNSSQAVGSQLSAGSLELESGRDTTILGSTLVADGAIDITAGHNLLVGSAENHDSSSSQSSVRKVGDVGEWYAPSYGRAKQSQSETSSSTQQVGSQIASLGGDISLKAGESYRQTASDVLALEGDIAITGKQVAIEAGYDQFEATYKSSMSTTAVGGSVSIPVVDAARSLDQLNETTKNTNDARLQTLAAATAAMKVSGAVDDAQALAKGDMGIKVSISLGNSRSSSTTTQSGQNAVGSTVNAGGNLTISATGAGEASDINVVGSQLKAGGNASLDAEGDISLQAAKNTAEQHSDNSGSGWSVGVGISVGGTANGLTLDLAANQSRGNADGSDLSWSNSSIQAGNQVDLVSGGDTTLKGAVVSGERVVADVGGNLSIESLQDTSTYESEQKSMGVGASICIPGFCAGASSVSASYSKQKIDSNYASVTEQSGIKAGNGGFDIRVEGNTDLKGAVISSSQVAVDTGLNTLDTGTLTHSDIRNYAEYDASSIGLSGGYSFGGNSGESNVGTDADGNAQAGASGKPLPSEGGFSATTPIALSAGDSDSSTTHSGISEGALTIRDADRQLALTGKAAEQTVADLKRDVTSEQDGSNALKTIFDLEEIETAFAITEAFIQESGAFLQRKSAETADAEKKLKEEEGKPEGERNLARIAELEQTVEDNKTWGMGGAGRLLLTALSAGAGGNVTGGTGEMLQATAANFAQGLAAQGVKQAAGDDDTTRALLHAAVGCLGAAGQGADCGSGALGASGAVALNALFDHLGGVNGADLTAEQKEARSNLVASLLAGAAAASGGDAGVAGAAGKLETENNGVFAIPAAVSLVSPELLTVVGLGGIVASNPEEAASAMETSLEIWKLFGTLLGFPITEQGNSSTVSSGENVTNLDGTNPGYGAGGDANLPNHTGGGQVVENGPWNTALPVAEQIPVVMLDEASEAPAIQIDPHNLIPTQTKNEMSGSEIRRLEKRMKEGGFSQDHPVDAWRRPDGRLEIQDGHHRTEAAKRAGIKSIPVRVWE